MKQRLAAVAVGLGLGLVAAVVPGGAARADVIRDDEWHLRYLGVAEANRHSRGEGVTIAVIDRGVDRAHADLAGAVLDPVAVSTPAGAGADATPRPSGPPVAEGTGYDPDGRGTALAGIIAGQGHGADHADGVIGVAPGAKIQPIVLDTPPTREPSADELAAGIEAAIAHRTAVIVIGYSVAGSERLLQAVRDAQAADAIVVAADGDQPGRAFDPYPAAYDGVLAAVPLGRTGEVLVSSTSGRRLGLGVPGAQIMTTNTGNRYRIDDGSASPGILAGAVALVRSAYPGVKAPEIVRRLRLTAADAGVAGPDADYGLGRLDLVQALTRRLPSPSPSPSAGGSRPGVSPAATPVAAPSSPRSRGPYGWLLGLPLLAVIAGVGVYAGLAERRIRISARNEVDSVGVQS
ncbi:S8 family serine peptidase [Dactylosporangium sp. NPDC000244]|uniref:S8 family serine peptidase n=1 Tax=Dactylosporangium sp. NPDC000244 TaxID=3154365 RepID=UPI003333A120